LTEVASTRRVQAVLAVFALLVVVVLGGDATGLFETPLPIPGGENQASPVEEGIDLRATRAACRFGVAISEAGTRGRTRIDAEALADAYTESFADLPLSDRRQIREACIDGIRNGLRAREG
jgi:hypothetical protein